MDESFRDRITTVDEKGKRRWLYPKKPKGKFYQNRSWLSYLLLIILFIGPWIQFQSNPLFLFNVIERKFILFGQIFGPHDFYLFVFILITFFIFIILFTTVYGRVFCGWTCPQTIFMEMVYRKIEYWIDGDYAAQKRLSKQPWNLNKIFKRVLKYGIFYLIALAIAHTFLAYIIGAEKLLEIQMDPIQEHLTGFIAILIFSGVFFLVYTWFREQICLIVCPYGRLQGVMLDANSLVVSYDFVRGEGTTGRERLKGKENRWETVQDEGKGSCVDCNQCVLVCPTGIDIRNGTQMECINCTACIDACNHMMDMTKQPRGLVRIDSRKAVENSVENTFTTRSKAYTVILILLLGLITFLFSLRSSVEAVILRTRGYVFQEQGEDIINLYNISIYNKSREDSTLYLKLLDHEGSLELAGNQEISVPQGKEVSGVFFVKIPKQKIKEVSFPITVGMFEDNQLIQSYQTTFLGPRN